MADTAAEDVEMAPPENKENAEKKNAAGGGCYKSPWVEAYRPRVLADVLGNEETVSRLQAIANDGNMPNLILCGPPGTGESRLVGRMFSLMNRTMPTVH